jgi:branched-chain amino acid transport system permease protein
MSTSTGTSVAPAGTGAGRDVAVRVVRGTRASWGGIGALIALVAVLGYLPYLVSRGTQVSLVTLFSLIVLGTMWNLLAGYAGMVSIGQQAYIGVGAYGLIVLADKVGMSPYVAVPLAALACGVVGFLASFLVFRLAGGYFAIGTWVLAEVARLVTTQVDDLGGGSGISLGAFSGTSPALRIAYVYWLSLAAAVAAVAAAFLLMRSKLGLGLTAIRDDATAAGSLGVDVTRSKRIVYVVSAMGCGLAGGMITASTLRVQPDSIFSVNYTAAMLFIVIIGGIGTIEGPVVGAVVYYLLQEQLADLGAWYLVILGLVAIAVTLFLPRGLWGLVSGGRYRVFPVGYRLDPRLAEAVPAPARPVD